MNNSKVLLVHRIKQGLHGTYCITTCTESEERGVLGVGSIPVAILPSCQYMKLLHGNHIDIHIVG